MKVNQFFKDTYISQQRKNLKEMLYILKNEAEQLTETEKLKQTNLNRFCRDSEDVSNEMK